MDPKRRGRARLRFSNETEGRQAVRKVKDEGADFVKVYSLLPREAYFAIADEAKKLPFGSAASRHVKPRSLSRQGEGPRDN
jgi:hypothetical protein